MTAVQFRDPRSFLDSVVDRRIASLHPSDYRSQVSNKRLTQFVDATEASDERSLIGRRFELFELLVLFQVDLVRIDWPSREIEHGRLLGFDELIDLLHGPRLRNAGAGAQ